MILAVLQARMSSTRLPGKVLRPLLGMPMIGRQIERLRRSQRISRLAVATSVDASDQPIAEFCASIDIGCHRGSLADVLDRYKTAAQAFGPASHIVRLTADCPLIDWHIVDECIALHLASGSDYTTNGVERSYPDGLDVEVMTTATLLKIHAAAAPGPEREHVTMHIYRNPQLFRIAHLVQERQLGDLRWTVDTPDDFRMVERVFQELLAGKPDFAMDDVLALLGRTPAIAAINAAKA